MTQGNLLDVPVRGLLDRLESFFKQRPGVWVDGMEIARYAGCYGWRSRVSELRTRRGLDIRNRQRRIGRRCISEYRLES